MEKDPKPCPHPLSLPSILCPCFWTKHWLAFATYNVTCSFIVFIFWFPQLVCEVLKGGERLAYWCLLNTRASEDIESVDRWIKPLFFWFPVSLTSSLLLLRPFSSLFSEAYVISLFYITFWFLSLLSFAFCAWSLLWTHCLPLFLQSSSSLSCHSLFWLPFVVFTFVLHNKNVLQISDDPVSSYLRWRC